ncbi:hypothetical protein EVAR_39810_1 [Eumeta japonica]|uniref:Uncharacterized protein n=1 Tax=Eumeta variegata TaxID=151549 RepID=A0A4C1XBY2_EUMVA|nr:hypothetical protein EVAR_39810_1 [Eumeta japonica]
MRIARDGEATTARCRVTSYLFFVNDASASCADAAFAVGCQDVDYLLGSLPHYGVITPEWSRIVMWIYAFVMSPPISIPTTAAILIPFPFDFGSNFYCDSETVLDFISFLGFNSTFGFVSDPALGHALGFVLVSDSATTASEIVPSLDAGPSASGVASRTCRFSGNETEQ